MYWEVDLSQKFRIMLWKCD